jgi:hypothetical protein
VIVHVQVDAQAKTPKSCLGGAPGLAGRLAGLGSFVPFTAALTSNNPQGTGFAEKIVELHFKDDGDALDVLTRRLCDRVFQARLAEKIQRLPPGAALERAMLDYARLRDQARTCASSEGVLIKRPKWP